MSDRKRNIFDAAQRVDFYGDANPHLAVELPYTVELFAANKTNLAKLVQAGITSASAQGAGQSGTRSKVSGADKIEFDCRLIVQTAKLIERKVAGFNNSFTLPRGNISYDELIRCAESFIADRVNYQTYFAKYALTEQFWTNLENKIESFKSAAQEQANAKRKRVGATADTEAVLADTLGVIKELDRTLKNHYRADPVKLAVWLSASRIRRKHVTEKEAPEEITAVM